MGYKLLSKRTRRNQLPQPRRMTRNQLPRPKRTTRNQLPQPRRTTRNQLPQLRRTAVPGIWIPRPTVKLPLGPTGTLISECHKLLLTLNQQTSDQDALMTNGKLSSDQLFSVKLMLRLETSKISKLCLTFL